MNTSPVVGCDNPRKRGRTACTRCKSRKQKCDDQWPVCSNCKKAGTECDKTAVIAEEEGLPIGYTRALEERVAFLELKLAQVEPQAADHAETAPSPVSPTNSHGNPLGEVVEYLSLGRFEAPAYVGSSSGLSLAVNLGEMVQATVWNKALPQNHNDNTSGRPTSVTPPLPTNGATSHRGRPVSMEELRANSADPPKEELGTRMVNAYLSQLHARYPFLDPPDIWSLHSARHRFRAAKSAELSQAERFGIFKLYLIYAIGAMLLQLTDKSMSSAPESYYMTALQQISAVRESRSIQNIEAMTLLVIYHLRSTSSHGLWYLVGHSMRACIDLGLHRKGYEAHLDPHTVQLRRRLFWTVYSLERVVSISLGRPFSIADRQIDAELPFDKETSSSPTDTPSTGPHSPAPRDRTSISLAIHLFKLRRIESRIQHSIYRADKPLQSLLPKLNRLHADLTAWKTTLLQTVSQPISSSNGTHYAPTSDTATGPAMIHVASDLTYPLLHYHRAMRLLIQPFLPLLPLTSPYYTLCLRSAGQICQTHKRLHQTLDYGHSFIAVQTVFVAGITLLYCLWTHGHKVWSVAVSNDLRACSLVLFVMGERVGWVKKYRDAWEVLVGATMERLEGGASAGAGAGSNISTSRRSSATEGQERRGMAEAAWELANGGNGSSSDRSNGISGINGQSHMYGSEHGVGEGVVLNDEAMRMVKELAGWIDQEENGTATAWIPDFEMLQDWNHPLL